MKWFGAPWPTEDLRAGVCENDADRIPVPIGDSCAGCDLPFTDGDRGVELPYVAMSRGGRTVVATRRYYHLRCFLALVLGATQADAILAAMDAL